jgi:hypothetical protein
MNRLLPSQGEAEGEPNREAEGEPNREAEGEPATDNRATKKARHLN